MARDFENIKFTSFSAKYIYQDSEIRGIALSHIQSHQLDNQGLLCERESLKGEENFLSWQAFDV